MHTANLRRIATDAASDFDRDGKLTSASYDGQIRLYRVDESGLAQIATGKITHKMLDFFVSERVKEPTSGRQTPVNPSPQGVPDFPIATVK